MGADQGVAAEGPAVHHADVQGRVQELVLREVLGVGQGPRAQRRGRGTQLCPGRSRPTLTTSNHLTRVLKLGFFL